MRPVGRWVIEGLAGITGGTTLISIFAFHRSRSSHRLLKLTAASLAYSKWACVPAESPDTRRAESQAQVGRWQSKEAGAIEVQRHEPKVDPNSAGTKTM